MVYRTPVGRWNVTSDPDITVQYEECKDHISTYSRVTGVTSLLDTSNLYRSLHRLLISGWYYGRMSWETARSKLRPAPVGTFLVRDSSDERHLFSLSVKTPRGTTSVRLVFSGGFRLDCSDPAVEPAMPRFDCIIALITHYVRLSTRGNSNCWVFYETSGRRDTPVLLTRPFHQRALPLKDLARRALYQPGTGNTAGTWTTRTDMDVDVQNFVNDYPYPV